MRSVIICSYIAICLAGTPVNVSLQSPSPELEYIGTYTISAYSEYEDGGQVTAMGVYPKPYRTVATTSQIPLGTVLYIEDVGEVVVEDRGGYLIESGERIDLFIGTDDPESWGLQQKEVYVVRW